MHRFVFNLPDVGEGTTEAEIIAWHVSVGDHVREDQHIVDVMTDKATVEITSPVTGRVTSLTGVPGDKATVGAPLVEFEVDGAEDRPTQADSPSNGNRSTIPVETSYQPAVSNKVLAAPAVRQRAVDLGIDLADVPGSAPEDRVTHSDLDAYISKRTNPHAHVERCKQVRTEEFEEVKLVGLRRRIAERMQEAKRRIPHFCYVEEIDMTELEDLRHYLNANRRSEQPKLSVLPFLIRAMARTLPDFPQINAHFDDEAGTIKRFKALHVGIATDTEAGLLVPVVHNADRLDLWQTAAEIARLATRARNAQSSRDELSGSTITITSLGPLGGVAATPIINMPETAILAPNAIDERPVSRNGQIVLRKMMNLSSCYDHRVVDGADAAHFIKGLKAMLEHPALMFMELERLR